MDQAEKLRSMIKQQNVSRNTARVITVTSGKGGVGKSNISVNLAIALSRLGKRVIILDADFGLANIEVMMGIRPIHNLADLMFRGKTLGDIITHGPENVGFISGGSGIQELTELTKEQIIYLIQRLVELDNMADVIIIDTGAGINNTVMEFVVASSEVLLVATPEPTSITDAYALLKALNRKRSSMSESTSIKMIANRVEEAREGTELYNKLGVVVKKFLHLDLEYLGNIPQDSNVSKSVIKQRPAILLYPNTGFSRAIDEFARKLCNQEPEGIREKRGIAQLFTSLLKPRIKN